MSIGSSDDANVKALTIADFGSNNASKKKEKSSPLGSDGNFYFQAYGAEETRCRQCFE